MSEYEFFKDEGKWRWRYGDTVSWDYFDTKEQAQQAAADTAEAPGGPDGREDYERRRDERKGVL